MIVGSGKTATDGIVWLLANGVPPDRIVWVRPRDPWMLNRAVVQPDPVVALGLAADTMAAAADAESLDDLFLRLEAAGVMLRIDTGRHSHDGQDPDPRRMGARSAPHHRERRSPRTHQARDSPRDRPRRRGRSHWRRARSSCTAPPPDCSTHRWFPSGGRTRSDSRRSGPASRASTRRSPATWRQPATTTGSATGCVRPTPSPTARPTGRGCRFVEPSRRARYGAEPDIAAWANGCALNPARIEPSQRDDPAVQAAAARLADARRARARSDGRTRPRATVERRRGLRVRPHRSLNTLTEGEREPASTCPAIAQRCGYRLLLAVTVISSLMSTAPPPMRRPYRRELPYSMAAPGKVQLTGRRRQSVQAQPGRHEQQHDTDRRDESWPPAGGLFRDHDRSHATIHHRLPTPVANMTSISAQQQPTQDAPWRTPSGQAAGTPRR